MASCQGEPTIKSAPVAENSTPQLWLQHDDIIWSMAWLSSGDMLVTLREGQLHQVNQGKLNDVAVAGLPKIAGGGQGGLLDVVAHPNYRENGWIYLAYSKADSDGNKSTAIIRGKLNDNRFVDQQEIYSAEAYSSGGHHFGGRIAFDLNNMLYFSIGDRGQRDENPQDLNRDAGKIYRLHDDGRIPADNPFIAKSNAKSAIFSYGHRNPQGLAMHPKTGEIWSHEHGPRGGDEVNLVQKGKNYGWPVISYGINYSGTSFTDLTEKEGMEQPLWYWDPSIAPSGMTFITSTRYPQWQGKLLVGSLKFGYSVLLTLDGNKVTEQVKLFEGLTRIRDVRQGPDGLIYIAVDGKGIYQIPASI